MELSPINHGTIGVDTTLTSFVVQSSKKYDGNYAGSLQYAFDRTAANAICEVENTQDFDISAASSLEMWFFGDNSRNELDFVFGSSQEKIVSVDTINWYGWRLVGMLRDTLMSDRYFQRFCSETFTIGIAHQRLVVR